MTTKKQGGGREKQTGRKRLRSYSKSVLLQTTDTAIRSAVSLQTEFRRRMRIGFGIGVGAGLALGELIRWWVAR